MRVPGDNTRNDEEDGDVEGGEVFFVPVVIVTVGEWERVWAMGDVGLVVGDVLRDLIEGGGVGHLRGLITAGGELMVRGEGGERGRVMSGLRI